jgi:hypothetical protein
MTNVEGCGAVGLPVLGGANGEADASDYDQLITNGFILRWDRENAPPTVARKFAHPNHLFYF